jgi:hypothetical protein
MSDTTQTEAIAMARRQCERQIKNADANIKRHAEAVIRAANDVLRNLQDGMHVHDFSATQSVQDLQKAIDSRKFNYDMISGLDYIADPNKDF